MSLGVVVRHRNNSDAQSPGLHNGPNGLTRNVPRNRWLLYAPQPDMNLPWIEAKRFHRVG
jgi:hypothetical protein